ncbi:MAG: YdiU family protein, partial [Candidatus Methylomirabilis sp.]|nr:YdiU family protein [Deltaproteobacteria bacterium]
PVTERYRPEPRFPDLGEGFADPVPPAQFPGARLRFRNRRWAARVGLGALTVDEWLSHFARFEPLPGNLERPLALRYHGHQFQAYNPQLGDGRGFLFAQMRDADDGRLLDLGTKGSGTTPYSRGGDGRLTLKGGVREALATEMLEALGVYTSKSFSLVETGEKLWRQDEPSPTRASVLVRLSHSHVRFGTFQRHAYHKDAERLRALVDYCAAHFYPALRDERPEWRPVALLREVARRSAELAASWMAAGFVHGVLNTDNMNVTGESFDYGPYRFLPTFDPTFVAAYFDHGGLYAFGRQPRIVLWNLERLGDALTPLAPAADLSGALEDYPGLFEEAFRRRFLARFGVRARDLARDGALVSAAYAFLAESQIGYERFFFDWFGGAASEPRAMAGAEKARYAGKRFEA